MGDELGDEWWKHDSNSDASDGEEEEKQSEEKTKMKPEKRKKVTEKKEKAKRSRDEEEKTLLNPQLTEMKDEESAKPKRKRKKKKKTIEDVLAASEPKPGGPADLRDLVTRHFSDKLSVIELEELKLPDSCFLSCNDLTHSLSSYLKQICPKWAKIQKQHTEKSSVVVLILCSSALRTVELLKQLTAFRGDARAVKLFAKHIKLEEQVKLLQKGVVHIGVGTPGRVGALMDGDALSPRALRYLVLDWNWRDQKLRRMVDIPEIKLDLMKLLERRILTACKEDQVKIGLF